MQTFTILNSGTNYDHNSGDIIAQLARKVLGEGPLTREAPEAHGWMLNAGPGSAAEPGFTSPVPKEQQKLGVTRESYGFAEATKLPKDFWLSGVAASLGSKGKHLIGALRGYGWEQNVVRSVIRVRERVMEVGPFGVPPKRVNMVGWSRGGVTCAMIAWALHNYKVDGEDPKIAQIINNLEVNIFAFDPVPGGLGAFGALDLIFNGQYYDASKVTLPPNVKDYVQLIAQHDNRPIFRPTLMTAPKGSQTHVTVYVMPGAHSSAVENPKGGAADTPVVTIAKHLVQEFLTKHETKRAPDLGWKKSDGELLALYGTVLATLPTYKKLAGAGTDRGLQYADGHARGRLKDHPLVINRHHEELLAKNYRGVCVFLNKCLDQGWGSLSQADALGLRSCQAAFDYYDELVDGFMTRVALGKRIPLRTFVNRAIAIYNGKAGFLGPSASTKNALAQLKTLSDLPLKLAVEHYLGTAPTPHNVFGARLTTDSPLRKPLAEQFEAWKREHTTT